MNRGRISAAVLAFGLTVLLAGCSAEKDRAETNQDKVLRGLNQSQMQSICELATLECYYHNTAKINSEKQVLFWNTSKKLWIEYSGSVKIGIDVSKLEMRAEDNVITITMPNAKVLSCHIDEESLTEENFYSETKGLGSGKVGAEDQTQAFRTAQENMQAMVEEDDALFLQARMRAQTLIENYVKSIGDAIGVEYEIQWEILTEDAPAR
ncbi:MAG: DUF4230 domain-containing protein [Acetatifactor sp.]|nr:DUF4230 domain-containing protein [Acetatifactor sp.]MDE7112723.1 DUF4230 domain-containing protein [Acetatifactor sp.]